VEEAESTNVLDIAERNEKCDTKKTTEQAAPWYTFRKNSNQWSWNSNFAETRLVIIEDYPALPREEALQHHMKVCADHYPFPGEIKGGGVTIDPGRYPFGVTSNYEINQCFSHEQDQKA
jgi:hypothetical protein